MRYIKVFALIFVFLVGGISSTYAADLQSSEEFVVEFKQPLSKKQLMNMVRKFNFVPTELRHQHEDMVSVYTIPKEVEVEEAFENMLAKHQEFLDVAVSSTEDEIAKERDTENKSRLGKMQSKFQSALKEVKDGMFRIHAVTVRDVGLLASREWSVVVSKVAPSSEILRQRGEGQQAKEQQISSLEKVLDFAISKAHASHGIYYVNPSLWVPRSGSSKTTQSMAFNTFYFPNVSGFSSFGGILTYEHETQVYEKNFADYDNYYSSNLPSHYLDFSKFDPDPTIDNFTVGSSQASSITVNTQYWTYMSLRPQFVSTALVRIKGQLGYREPSSCHSPTFCIWPTMTTGSLVMYYAPISYQQSWTYNP
ncbi:MAG: hypothetical protein Q7K40_05205 [bacterium]|nr:hypothetical protein [bacterium]